MRCGLACPNKLYPLQDSLYSEMFRFSIKKMEWNDINCPVLLKAHANGPNIVGQQHPTLLGPTMLWLVASVCMEPQQCWLLLALVAYSLKPVKLLGPCKRTQHCWPTTPNSVESCWHLLSPFAWALRNVWLLCDCIDFHFSYVLPRISRLELTVVWQACRVTRLAGRCSLLGVGMDQSGCTIGGFPPQTGKV